MVLPDALVRLVAAAGRRRHRICAWGRIRRSVGSSRGDSLADSLRCDRSNRRIGCTRAQTAGRSNRAICRRPAREPRPPRHHDGRWSRVCIVVAVRSHAVFRPVASHPSCAHWSGLLLALRLLRRVDGTGALRSRPTICPAISESRTEATRLLSCAVAGLCVAYFVRCSVSRCDRRIRPSRRHRV